MKPFNSALAYQVVATAAMISNLGCAVPALAQQPQAIHVVIPFDFDTACSHFHAGTYRINMRSTPFTAVTSENSKEFGYVMGDPEARSAADKRGRLLFHRYGNQYFLSEIWAPGNPMGQRILPSRKERDVRIAIARAPNHAGSSSDVALVANDD
ncbi:hypothetical protein [Acidipila sp. EB88]|uniref:hypothetical protein n=1 Tax=Acidipila sp. EB88 TaxID=2305226 RepID=UPI000F5EE0DE|nr:hypothetical protein [Acidipila sp. EB88]RRA47557.1 hypothetical protein D1Y84_03835 [Acidipila sp. EB88]